MSPLDEAILHMPLPKPMIMRKPSGESLQHNTPSILVTESAFKSTSDFTKETLALTFSPKYSLFVQGLKMSLGPKGSGMMSGLENALGVLMVMASPIYGLFRFGLGIPLSIGGAIATGLTGAVLGAEWTGKKIENQINHLSEPSAADIKREKLTALFVERMQSVINSSPYPTQVFFKDNPAQLISIAMVMVAFRSKAIDGKALWVDEKILSEDGIKDQDDTHKQFFKDVCEIKYAIQSLHLSPDEEYAWEYLKLAFEKSLHREDSSNLPYDEKIEDQTIQMIMATATKLGVAVVQDETFTKHWNGSL